MLKFAIALVALSLTSCEQTPKPQVEQPGFVERYAAAPATTMFEYSTSERAKILKELEAMPQSESETAALELLGSKSEPVLGTAFSTLTEPTRTRLAAGLTKQLGADPTLWQELEKSRLLRIRDEPELTKKGLMVLTRDAATMQAHQWGVDRYLKAYALHEPKAASQFACDVLSRDALPDSMKNGNPNQITFAAVAATKGTYCKGIDNIETDMCAARCLRECSAAEMQDYVDVERKYNQFQESTKGAQKRPGILPMVVRANHVLAGRTVDCSHD